jgi:SAM-dependent methyltransferase
MNIQNVIAQQSKKPSGILGLINAAFMKKKNIHVYDWVIELLAIQKTDKILEIGFASGDGIKKISKILKDGFIAGIDISEIMVKKAIKFNDESIQQGRVDIKLGGTGSIPYAEASFDKVFAINVVYFLEDPIRDLKELYRVLKKNGLITLFVFSYEDMVKHKFTQTGLFKLYKNEDLMELLNKAGFKNIRLDTKRNIFKNETGVCVLAEK